MTHTQHATPCFAIYKSQTKARLIFDMRAYNKVFPRPPPFSLPAMSQLLKSGPLSRFWFAKVDVQNCFWSISLPPAVTGYFPLHSGVIGCPTYGSRQLPFGWSWSPLLAQLTIHDIITPLHTVFLCWQFIDDILIAHEDPYFLTFGVEYLVYILDKHAV